MPVSEPLYLQVKRLLLKQITSNKWQPNEQLPNEFELASSFNVSQGTIRKALSALTDEGFLTRVQGKGTFISDLSLGKSMLLFFRVKSNDEPTETSSQTYGQVLDSAIITPDKTLINTYKVDTKDRYIYVERLRVLDGNPIIFEKIYLPVDIFKNLQVDDGDLASNNLYRMYQNKHSVYIDKAKENIFPEIATAEIKTLLPEAHLLLRIERIATNQEGVPVEYRTYWVDSQHAHYYANLSRY